MRRTTSLAVRALLALALVIPPIFVPAPASAATRFTITGSGYGHGIGMSQYGAKGYAVLGWKYDAILTRYYSPTTIGTRSPGNVRVNVDTAYHPGSTYSGRSSWTMRSVSVDATAYAGSSKMRLVANRNYVFRNISGKVTIKSSSESTRTFSSDVTVTPKAGGLVEVESSSGPFSYTRVRYRGSMSIARIGTSHLSAVNVVPMQQYLYGVVPRESPSSWPAEALKAQAVAARSYAFSDVNAGRTLACNTYSQMYGGQSRVKSDGTVERFEADSSNDAVQATDDKVIIYDGSVVKAYFSSSSGGHTANIEDVWVTSTLREPFRGVDDLAAEKAAGSPYLSWGPIYVYGDSLASKLRARGISGVPDYPASVTDVALDTAASGHTRYVTFGFTTGAHVKVSGDSVRSMLGLKSTRFKMYGFPITRIYGADRYSTSAAVSRSTFTTAPAAVIARGDVYTDALIGSALAGAKHGTMLLTSPTSLPSSVRTELGRAKPKAIYLIGGTSSISTDVYNAIHAALPSATIERVGTSPDRYARSVQVARNIGTSTGKAFIVNGSAWTDAVSASALAYAKGYPILLTPTSGLPTSVKAYLAEDKCTPVVLGGTASVPSAVLAQAQTASGKTAVRLSGSDRFATSVAIARWSSGEGFGYPAIYLASGRVFPDALSASVIAGKWLRPIVLTDTNSVPKPVASFLDDKRSSIKKLVIVGGPASVSSSGVRALDNVMSN